MGILKFFSCKTFPLLILIVEITQASISPPIDLKAFDTPNDAGKSITLSWKKSKEDEIADSVFLGYNIYRAQANSYNFVKIAFCSKGTTSYRDSNIPKDKIPYHYLIRAISINDSSVALVSIPVQSSGQLYNRNLNNALVGTVLLFILVIFSFYRAKSGKPTFIRKIAGLAAVEEAVGRATEMGRSVLYVPGLNDLSDIATISAVNILAQIAKKTAEYDIPLIVPNYDAVVYAVTQEVVKESYTYMGRPDAYNPKNIYYITTNQMGFTAAVDGIMMREKPATNFFMGYFYAEALILAETGNATGAIQIAGTDAVLQLPFFVTSCDYTLMGEELYAASAYLSREPILVGTLKSQDWAKVIILALILFGTAFTIFTRNPWFVNLFSIG